MKSFCTLILSLLVAVSAGAAPKAAAAGQTKLTWWGHAAWYLETPAGTRIAIDPWFNNPKAPKNKPWPGLDLLLVSHGHFDHVGDTVALDKKNHVQVIGCYELISQLGVETPVGANIGGTIKFRDVTIHLVEAVHSSGFTPDTNDKKAPPLYGGAPVGFVIEIENGPTIYHAGDTGVFKDMELIGSIYKPSIALLPIGGFYTMDPDLAAIAAGMLKARTIVPMHFGTFPALAGTPAELKTALKKRAPSSNMVEFLPGETKTF
jgi:L-ascorbate metabolism protein UlaG (beta-lactamase superfamily)